MRYDERFLDEIKSRLRLSDVIGRTVKLRRQGREYAGLSPFTKEKTPSFYVNDDKGFYHCFSSGKHGDLISFLQETERLSFPEAVERLAGEAGVPMPVQDERQVEQDKKRATLQDWLDAAAAWYEGELRRPAGQAARAYLAKRALPEDDWKRFRLGYAPAGRTALKDYLVQKGARPADLVQAGLLIAPEDGGAPYDRFRDRIIFPITDMRGRVISFGGRALDPEAKAKYLNGPETDLFSKSQVLYGMYDARKLLGAGEADAPLVVVEGYMDVIACQRAGVAAVAGMGTALTDEQMALMWRFHPEPTLCFDGDGAGRRAAARAIDRALPQLKAGRSFKFAIVTGGKDPDDVLRERGPAALKAQLAQTTPFVEALFVRDHQLEPLDTPERRAGFKVRLRQAAQLIQDKDLSEQYRNDLLSRFDAAFPRSSFVPGWHKRNDNLLELIRTKNAPQILRERAKRLNASVVIKGIDHPDWLLPYVEEISAFGFGDEKLAKIVMPITNALCQDEITCKMIRDFIRHEGAQSVYDTAYRIAMEVPTLDFVNESISRELAKSMWIKSFEGIVELAAILFEISDRKIPDDVDANEYIDRRRKLWLRRTELEQRLSALTIWN